MASGWMDTHILTCGWAPLWSAPSSSSTSSSSSRYRVRFELDLPLLLLKSLERWILDLFSFRYFTWSSPLLLLLLLLNWPHHQRIKQLRDWCILALFFYSRTLFVCLQMRCCVIHESRSNCVEDDQLDGIRIWTQIITLFLHFSLFF